MNSKATTLLILLALSLALAPLSRPSAAQPPDPATVTPQSLAWELLTEAEPVRLWSSPHYEHDATLYLTTPQELRRTTDDGDSWRTLYATGSPTLTVAGMAFDPEPQWQPALFVAVNGPGSVGRVLRSTDDGLSWRVVLTDTERPILDVVAVRDVGGELVVFAVGEERAWRSPHAGDLWEPLHAALPEAAYLYRLFPSPDFAVDGTLYATGFTPAIRSTDGGFTWERVPIPWVDVPREIRFSPDYTHDRTLWVSYFWIEGSGEDDYPMNGVVRSTDGGATWEKVNEGLPVDWPDASILGLTVSPEYVTDEALFLVQRTVSTGDENYVLYRTPDRGETWIFQGAAPNVTARGLLAARRDLLFLSTIEGLYRLHLPCTEWLRNGDCELNEVWDFPATPITAGYTTEQARSPERSLRVGLTTAANKHGYSSARQWVTLPGTLVTATLEVWLYPLSTAGQTAQLSPAATTLPAAMTGDAQYLLVMNEQGAILERLLWTRSNSRQWESHTFDLSAYIGQSIWLLFGVYNDGVSGVTGMYVDDVSLQGCRPPSTPPASPEPPPPLPLPRIAPVDEDFLVSDAPDVQYRPALAYNGLDDEALLVWEDGRAGYPNSVYAQRVSSNGKLLGDAFEINRGQSPQVAFLGPAGVYLVIWEDYRHVGQTPDIYAQRVDRDGQLLGADFAIYSGPGYQGWARVAASPQEGNFLVVWAHSIDGASAVVGRRVDATGVLLDPPIGISDGSGWAGHPSVAYNATSSEYVAVWSDTRDGPHNNNIYGQRVSAQEGALVSGNFPVSTRIGWLVWPVIAIEPGEGRIFVAWEEEWPGGGRDLYGRQLAADGTPLAQEFAIAERLASSAMVAATAWTDAGRNEFLVLWQTYTSSGDLAALRYAPGGGPLGTPFFISHERYTQAHPAVAAMPNGAPPAYLVVWEDYRASVAGIYGQRVTPEGEKLGLPTGLTPLPHLQTQPALAYSSTSDRSLAVWANVHGGGGNQQTHVMGYLLRANRELPTTPITLTQAVLTTTTQVSVDWDAWNDEFLVVWSAGGNIAGQRVAADGSLAGDNLALSALTGAQEAPVVAAGMHAYLVIFEHTHPVSLTTDIHGQLLTPTGAPLGPAVNISRLPEADQQARNAHLTYNALDNTFYVVWEEEDPASPGLTLWQIAGQVVAGEDGSPLGPRRTLAAAPEIQENHPRIAWAGAEDAPFYLLVWSAFDMQLGQAEIMARRLGQDGAPVGEPYPLTATQLEQDLRPALSYDPFTRRFLVVWDAVTQGMPYADAIWTRQLDAEGQPEGPARLLVQELQTARHSAAVTARRGHAAWLVAWEDGRADRGAEHVNVYARRVSRRTHAYLPLVLRQ